MCATRVLHPIVPSSVNLYTPINAVIKNSYKYRARANANVVITNQASLTYASDILVSQGLAKIKIRLTTDHTATGLNSCSYSPVFSHPSIADALDRYFHSYPTAHDDRAAYAYSIGGFLVLFQELLRPYCMSLLHKYIWGRVSTLVYLHLLHP